eukprot:4875190-Alexandrium_andersonii.AAC.1
MAARALDEPTRLPTRLPCGRAQVVLAVLGVALREGPRARRPASREWLAAHGPVLHLWEVLRAAPSEVAG